MASFRGNASPEAKGTLPARHISFVFPSAIRCGCSAYHEPLIYSVVVAELGNIPDFAIILAIRFERDGQMH